mmetsp:Transcript_5522/g.13801  ORF Transcript_5522/g.13801 Transcript_5522/m.13801 type:complete len:107 (-) Transcript_5522:650-970(-)
MTTITIEGVMKMRMIIIDAIEMMIRKITILFTLKDLKTEVTALTKMIATMKADMNVHAQIIMVLQSGMKRNVCTQEAVVTEIISVRAGMSMMMMMTVTIAVITTMI